MKTFRSSLLYSSSSSASEAAGTTLVNITEHFGKWADSILKALKAWLTPWNHFCGVHKTIREQELGTNASSQL
ncbi:hypothetical protein K457DRAFT_23594 [Linnemannia elongata AG-77]|uniref:Uncharacterized protein n=1 Tax=Linnemannia elongata AG-77 TaxID=1314771 RepID=A0A197JKI3_9FUNG|nr:hypothetical protein K457DRAFT_23594 [Linnemannia elongata AG-77]